MKTSSLVATVCTALLLLLPQGQGARAESATSNAFNLSITLPARWSIADKKDSKNRLFVRFRDRDQIADIKLIAIPKPGKFSNIDEWMEKKVIPKNIDKYAKNKVNLNTVPDKKRSVFLKSGQKAKAITYNLDLLADGQADVRKNAGFIYFSDPDNRFWIFAFIFNTSQGVEIADEIDGAMTTIAGGIALH